MFKKKGGKFSKKYKIFGSFSKEVHEDLNISKKKRCFSYYFQSSPLHKFYFWNPYGNFYLF